MILNTRNVLFLLNYNQHSYFFEGEHWEGGGGGCLDVHGGGGTLKHIATFLGGKKLLPSEELQNLFSFNLLS